MNVKNRWRRAENRLGTEAAHVYRRAGLECRTDALESFYND